MIVREENRCQTSHYSFNEEIDVRFDGKPLKACGTFCYKHNHWISLCSYEWQEQALKLRAVLLEVRQKIEGFSSAQQLTEWIDLQMKGIDAW